MFAPQKVETIGVGKRIIEYQLRRPVNYCRWRFSGPEDHVIDIRIGVIKSPNITIRKPYCQFPGAFTVKEGDKEESICLESDNVQYFTKSPNLELSLFSLFYQPGRVVFYAELIAVLKPFIKTEPRSSGA